MNDAETCRRKMQAASTLIQGLSGEKSRWTEKRREFKSQINRYQIHQKTKTTTTTKTNKLPVKNLELAKNLRASVVMLRFPPRNPNMITQLSELS